MNNTFKIVFGVAAVMFVLPIIIAFNYIGWSNDANKFEVDIPTQYQQMKNVYDNGWKEVMETAQVPENYSDDMQKIWQQTLNGRYGDKGSQAMMQFIKESNPQLDPSLYRKVQDRIEEFHETFSASQTRIISLKQSYNTFLVATTSGRLYNNVGHYPHIRVGIPYGTADDFAIVTSDKTENDFYNHKADVLQLRKK